VNFLAASALHEAWTSADTFCFMLAASADIAKETARAAAMVEISSFFIFILHWSISKKFQRSRFRSDYFPDSLFRSEHEFPLMAKADIEPNSHVSTDQHCFSCSEAPAQIRQVNSRNGLLNAARFLQLIVVYPTLQFGRGRTVVAVALSLVGGLSN